MRYRLLTGQHGRWEDGQNVVYRKGAEIDLSPEEVESLGPRRVEKIAGAAKVEPPQVAAEVAPAPETETTVAAGPLGLDALHWAKAAAAVSGLATAEWLDAAEAEEKAGKDRKGVLEAIAARRAELEG